MDIGKKAEGRPRVTVVMPAYNSEGFIEMSIQSVIAQTLTDWEIEIVDDCSTDDTYEVVRPYLKQYPSIHYTCLDTNGGPGVARTEAIRRANGKYIAFLDSDDLWLPEKLEKQIAFMEKTGAVFSCTAYEQIDEEGNSLHKILEPPEETDYNKMIRLSCPIGNLTVMYNQEALGKYEVPLIRKRNDFALWLRIVKDAGYCAGMPEVLARYRVRSGSTSRNKLGLVRYQWQLYHDIEGLGFLRSCWYMNCWAVVKGSGALRRSNKSI